jgi:hypothetical protein
MKKQRFGGLTTSVRQAGAIRRGEMVPSRVTEFPPEDSKAMRNRFKIAHLMILIAILAVAFAVLASVSRETMISYMALLFFLTPIGLIASEMCVEPGSKHARLQTWIFRLYLTAAAGFLLVYVAICVLV